MGAVQGRSGRVKVALGYSRSPRHGVNMARKKPTKKAKTTGKTESKTEKKETKKSDESSAVTPNRPERFALHGNTQGEPDRIGRPDELLVLPVIALLLWLADLAGAVLVHRRERLAALFLYAGGVVVQVVFWAAVLTIVLRAVARG